MRIGILLLVVSTFALAACATSGIGTGSTLGGDLKATLSWQSKGGHSGSINAALSNGENYAGTYFQITHDTRVEDLSPLWNGWPHRWWNVWDRWNDWGPWRPTPSFVTTYSGRVVANLEGPNGTHMRCRFFLQRPASGMSGGGQGTCQLPGGGTIDATFPGAG
jgi:hypothetical protein